MTQLHGLRQDFRATVDRTSKSVEHTSQHIFGYTKLHTSAKEPYLTVGKIDSCRTLKQLYQCGISVNFQNLAATCLPAYKFDLSQFVKRYVFSSTDHHKRSGNFLNGSIFFWHLEVLLSECVRYFCRELFCYLLISSIQLIFVGVFKASDLLTYRHTDQLIHGRPLCKRLRGFLVE